MYKGNSRYPAELRFSSSFEKLVERWNQDWAKSWNDYTRRFDFTAGSDLNNIEQNLRPIFAGAEVYPNLINQLLDIRQSFEAKKDWDSATKAAKIAAELYPQSDRANVFFAISLLIIGKRDEARTALKRAVDINPNGIASPRVLNQVALALAGADKLTVGIAWLESATEIYANDVSLLSTLGDFYLKNSQSQQAFATYKRILTIDPNSEHAKAMLTKQTP